MKYIYDKIASINNLFGSVILWLLRHVYLSYSPYLFYLQAWLSHIRINSRQISIRLYH